MGVARGLVVVVEAGAGAVLADGDLDALHGEALAEDGALDDAGELLGAPHREVVAEGHGEHGRGAGVERGRRERRLRRRPRRRAHVDEVDLEPGAGGGQRALQDRNMRRVCWECGGEGKGEDAELGRDEPEGALRADTQILQDEPNTHLVFGGVVLLGGAESEGTDAQAADQIPREHAVCRRPGVIRASHDVRGGEQRALVGGQTDLPVVDSCWRERNGSRRRIVGGRLRHALVRSGRGRVGGMGMGKGTCRWRSRLIGF